MSSIACIGQTRHWDEGTAAPLSADTGAAGEPAPVSNWGPAGADRLRAPSDPSERHWDALEALHRKLNRLSR